MSDARIILRNLTANWVGHGANLVVMFFLSPYIVHTLGVTEYGIWQLLTVLTGYMGLLDLGVRASTGRYIILYLGQNQHEKVDETIRTGLGALYCPEQSDFNCWTHSWTFFSQNLPFRSSRISLDRSGLTPHSCHKYLGYLLFGLYYQVFCPPMIDLIWPGDRI